MNIAEAIINVLGEHNLSNKALALTTDNASAMLVCGRTIAKELADNFSNLTFTHYRCALTYLILRFNKDFNKSVKLSEKSEV